MLRPEVIRDLHLARHGLKMVPCDPGLQAVFEDGAVYVLTDSAAGRLLRLTPNEGGR